MGPITQTVGDCLAILAVCVIGLVVAKVLLGLADRLFGGKDGSNR